MGRQGMTRARPHARQLQVTCGVELQTACRGVEYLRGMTSRGGTRGSLEWRLWGRSTRHHRLLNPMTEALVFSSEQDAQFSGRSWRWSRCLQNIDWLGRLQDRW